MPTPVILEIPQDYTWSCKAADVATRETCSGERQNLQHAGACADNTRPWLVLLFGPRTTDMVGPQHWLLYKTLSSIQSNGGHQDSWKQ
jgi:hypothetical protein